MLKTDNVDDRIVIKTYRPTGTYSDALSAKVKIREFLDNPAEVKEALLALAYDASSKRMFDFGQDLDERDLGTLMRWNVSTDDLSPVLYLDANVAAPIVESASNVPEPDDLSTLMTIPPAGILVFQEAIHDPMFEGVLVSAISWTLLEEAEAGCELFVTSWVYVQDGPRVLFHPFLPVWISGRSPRMKGINTQGEEYGWLDKENFLLRFMVSLNGWLEVAATPHEEIASRPARRAAQRARVEPSKITTIKFRKLASKPWDADAAKPSGREYSHRWIRSAHWRSQPCGPGNSERRPVLIAPQIYGPPDKPLLVKDRIWKVDRV